jgi:hypothetical protein
MLVGEYDDLLDLYEYELDQEDEEEEEIRLRTTKPAITKVMKATILNRLTRFEPKLSMLIDIQRVQRKTCIDEY